MNKNEIERDFRKSLIQMISNTDKEYVPLSEPYDHFMRIPQFLINTASPMTICQMFLFLQKNIIDQKYKYVDFDFELNFNGGFSQLSFRFKNEYP